MKRPKRCKNCGKIMRSYSKRDICSRCFEKTDEFKERRKKYQQSDKFKERRKKYRQSNKYKEYQKKYRQKHKKELECKQI